MDQCFPTFFKSRNFRNIIVHLAESRYSKSAKLWIIKEPCKELTQVEKYCRRQTIFGPLHLFNTTFQNCFSDNFEGYIWEHPIELKKLLIGDLSQEMTVQVRRNCEAAFKLLTHQDCDPNFDQVGDVICSLNI